MVKNIDDYRNKKKEAYMAEVDAVMKRFEDDNFIEVELNRDEMRMMNGIEPEFDPFDMLRKIATTGTNLKEEIARINRKYGIPGDKVKTDWD